jgi:hypothetical protein
MTCSSVQVYDYHGKLLCAPKHPAINSGALSRPMVSVSDDVVAILEPAKRTAVHFFATAGGAAAGAPLRIRRDEDRRKLVGDGNVAIMDIVSIALSQFGDQARALHLRLCRVCECWALHAQALT